MNFAEDGLVFCHLRSINGPLASWRAQAWQRADNCSMPPRSYNCCVNNCPPSSGKWVHSNKSVTQEKLAVFCVLLTSHENTSGACWAQSCCLRYWIAAEDSCQGVCSICQTSFVLSLSPREVFSLQIHTLLSARQRGGEEVAWPRECKTLS